MPKRKKGHPSIEDVLARPWCYYCERDFDDLKILISHQKAKHFKCDRCGRRLNTAGGLSVHMNQVHKEQLTSVENALPNRQGLEVEIFGMEGIPDDIMQTHNTRVMQQYYEEAAERRAKSGNPLPGEALERKKIKLETQEELLKRFQEWRTKKLNGDLGVGITQDATPPVPAVNSPAPAIPTPFGQQAAPAATGFPPQQVPGQAFHATNPPSFPTGLSFPPSQSPFPGAPSAFAAHSATGSPASNLPPRPGFNAPPVPGQFPGAPILSAASNGQAATAADVDDLIASVTGQASKAEAPEKEKKGKKDKDKSSRLVYSDNEISPEEKMALLPRYAFTAA